jgi:hypothetical protein
MNEANEAKDEDEEALKRGYEELIAWLEMYRHNQANDEACRKKGIPILDEWLEEEDER